MTIESQKMKVRVTCKDKDKSFSYMFPGIALGAGDDEIYELGSALNSLQDIKAKTFIKTVESMLTIVE